MEYNPFNKAMPSSRQLIDAALSCTTGPYALCYADPNQKWIIRDHLISLFQDFPYLRPSVDSFTHNDGIAVTLLKANGEILVSPSIPPIIVTIWVHENYPIMAPSVYISSNSEFPVYCKHPFVDSSGSVTSYYLQNWQPAGCNLSELVRNLVKLFSFHHPFSCYFPSSSTHPSLVSKREAVDRLACMLCYDMVDMQSKTEKEMNEYSVLQAEMVKRADIATGMVVGLEQERMNLKEHVKKLGDDADVLLNWLKVYNKNSAVAMIGDIDDAFEAEDEKSELMLNYLAADKAMEDVLYALDSAVENGVIDFEIYIKQVRSLARKQFMYRSNLIKLERS